MGEPTWQSLRVQLRRGSSLILFGLHRSGNRMIDCPDGVVSATIRQAHCPVMTVPPNLSHR